MLRMHAAEHDLSTAIKTMAAPKLRLLQRGLIGIRTAVLVQKETLELFCTTGLSHWLKT